MNRPCRTPLLIAMRAKLHTQTPEHRDRIDARRLPVTNEGMNLPMSSLDLRHRGTRHTTAGADQRARERQETAMIEIYAEGR
jgi:hypothetical protein